MPVGRIGVQVLVLKRVVESLEMVVGMELAQGQNSIVQVTIHASAVPPGSKLVDLESTQVAASTVVV